MAPLDDFESILKDVVQAKRLSASKMGKLTEIALKSMEHDTQLVSILYRTHKSLPAAAKVASLYVFDALSRAARHQVNKQGLTGDINSAKGNCATFLLKVEGVLEGLFQDMIIIGSVESKDKTKKILDIWVKGNTFPSNILSRLTDVVMDVEKVPEVKPLTTADPRAVIQPIPNPPVSTASPVAPMMDPQATLLALLAQAANVAVAPNSSQQTTANTGVYGAGLDATQLAVLQQLALAQTSSNANPSQPALHRPLPVPSGSAFPTPSSSYGDDSYNSLHEDRKHDRHRTPERSNAHDDQFDDRASSRGGYRGGFRGRRGEGRSRWDDRDRDRYRERERDWSPSRKGRRSRSRSPPSRYGGRRDVRPYSPPRRPSLTLTPVVSRGQKDNTDSAHGTRDIEKDEFGRDIRPQSPENDSTPIPQNKSIQPPPPDPVDKPIIDSSPAITSNHERMSLSPLVAANTSASTPSASFVSNTVSSQSGMENFDLATFDFTSPSSWEALGKMWQVTYGYLPTTEQLMQFVMATGQGPVTGQTSSDQNRPSSSTQTWRGGRGRESFRGRGAGGLGRGNARDAQERWNHNDSNQATDAIVLGETTESDDPEFAGKDDSQMDLALQNQGGGSGGRMQRIEDKWVFVRDPATEV